MPSQMGRLRTIWLGIREPDLYEQVARQRGLRIRAAIAGVRQHGAIDFYVWWCSRSEHEYLEKRQVK